METLLQEEFNEKLEEYESFKILMQELKKKKRIMMVVCLGAGDAFQKRYWPFLRELIKRDKIRLALVDSNPLSDKLKEDFAKCHHFYVDCNKCNKLSDKLKEDFAECPNNRIKFIQRKVGQKSSSQICVDDWYEFLIADIVFVLVPDYIHVKATMEWLDRAKAIFVEKPYDEDLKIAGQLLNIIKGQQRRKNKATTNLQSIIVIPFDHYFGKIEDLIFNLEANEIHDYIGDIDKITFSLTEDWPIERYRVESLKNGMIFDLFCHILAIIHPFVEIGSIDIDNNKTKVLAARHHGALITKDTFAYFEFVANSLTEKGENINVEGYVGKGVQKQEKYLRLIGKIATLELNFLNYEIKILSNTTDGGSENIPIKVDERSTRDAKLNNGHENFLEAIFDGNYIEKPIGGLTQDTAIKILYKLIKFKGKVNEMYGDSLPYEYPLFSSKEDIIKLITNKKVSKDTKAILFDADVLEKFDFPAEEFNCPSHDDDCWIWSIVKIGVVGTIPKKFVNVINDKAKNYRDLAVELGVKLKYCMYITNNLNRLNETFIEAKENEMSVVFVGDTTQSIDIKLHIKNFHDLKELLMKENGFLEGYWVRANQEIKSKMDDITAGIEGNNGGKYETTNSYKGTNEESKNNKTEVDPIPHHHELISLIRTLFSSTYQKERPLGKSDEKSKTLEFLRTHLQYLTAKDKEIRWLDVGCGNGRCLDVLKVVQNQKKIRYHGIDFSKTYFDEARKLASKYDLIDANFEIVDAAVMKYKSRYDIISSVLLLHEIDPLCLPYVLRNILCALKKNGTLVISDFEGPYEQEKKIVAWSAMDIKYILEKIGGAKMSIEFTRASMFPEVLGFYSCYVTKPKLDEKGFEEFMKGYAEFLEKKTENSINERKVLRSQIETRVKELLPRKDIDTKNISAEDEKLIFEKIGNEYGIRAFKESLLNSQIEFLYEKITQLKNEKKCKGEKLN